MWKVASLLTCATILLAGCGTVMTDSCDWAEPIRPSVDDVLSDGTAQQILTHNLTGERLGGWRP